MCLETVKDVIIKAQPEWSNVPKESIFIEKLNGCGGSKTFKVHTTYESVDSNINKVVFHSRIVNNVYEINYEARLEEIHKLIWEAELTIPRQITGKDWWIEKLVDNKIDWNDKNQGQKFAKSLALLHNKVNPDWFEKHRVKMAEEIPILNEAIAGSHIWTFACNFGLYNYFLGENPEFRKIFQDFSLEPFSEAGKKIVTAHADLTWHNALVDPEGNPYIIDFETCSAQWAAHEFSYMFRMEAFGTGTVEGRWNFVREYLKHRGFPYEDKDVELLVFDAQCCRSRVFWPSIIIADILEKKLDPDYKCLKQLLENIFLNF